MLLYLDLYCVCNEMYITYIWVHALSRVLAPTIFGSGPIHEKKFKMLSNIQFSRVKHIYYNRFLRKLLVISYYQIKLMNIGKTPVFAVFFYFGATSKIPAVNSL